MRDEHGRAVGDEPQLPLTGALRLPRFEPWRDVAIDPEDDALAAGGIERPARVDVPIAAVAAAVHEAAFPGAVALEGLFDGHARLGEAGLEEAV